MNKRSYELLRNLEILCFIKEEKLNDYINYFKEKIFIDNNESRLIKYFENNWYKKYKSLFNYSFLINNILKIKNAYKNNNYNKKSEVELISIIKSLEKVYTTNNICENIHSKLTGYISNKKITKNNFRDAICSILNNYSMRINTVKRSDYITKILILIVQKI